MEIEDFNLVSIYIGYEKLQPFYDEILPNGTSSILITALISSVTPVVFYEGQKDTTHQSIIYAGCPCMHGLFCLNDEHLEGVTVMFCILGG